MTPGSFTLGRLDRFICPTRRTYFMIRSQRIDSRTEQIWQSMAGCVYGI